jgi:hypothetical protein
VQTKLLRAISTPFPNESQIAVADKVSLVSRRKPSAESGHDKVTWPAPAYSDRSRVAVGDPPNISKAADYVRKYK